MLQESPKVKKVKAKRTENSVLKGKKRNTESIRNSRPFLEIVEKSRSPKGRFSKNSDNDIRKHSSKREKVQNENDSWKVYGLSPPSISMAKSRHKSRQ